MPRITPQTTAGPVTLNAGQRKTLMSLKRPVINAAQSFGVVREKLTDLAPKIVKFYNGLLNDNESFTFVEFARLFDNTVPTHARPRDGKDGYQAHRVYYTLQYMRRLVQTRGRNTGQQGVRDSATDALARTLATILQVVDDPNAVYSTVQQEFGFSERLMTRLRNRVQATKPLFKLPTAKPLHVGPILHMARTAEEPAAVNGGRQATGADIAADVQGRRKKAA